MAIQTLHDTGSSYSITPKMDGGVYGTGISDCVCAGIGDEFTLSYSNNNLNVQFAAGSQAIIGGAFFKVMSLETVALTANSTIYLCANIDLSKANGVRGSFVRRTSSNMQSGNLNGNGTSRDLLLYVITTNANGVVTVSDRRYIKGNGTASIGDLDTTNLEIISNINNLNQTNIQTISNGAIPVLTTAPTSAYTGGGAKVVYLTSEPANKYNGYIYLIKD